MHDLCWVPVVVVLSYWVRFDLFAIPEIYVESMVKMIVISLPVQAAAFWYFGLYRGLWRYASMQDLIRVVKAVGLGSIIIITTIAIVLTLYRVPRTVLVLYPIFLTIGLIAPRVLYRWLKENSLQLRKKTGKRTLIVGAGSAGEMLLRDLVNRHDYLPVALVDDDQTKQEREIHGIRVVGKLEDISELIDYLELELILIAIANIDRKIIRSIIKTCMQSNVECRTIPASIELADGKVNVDQVRPITVEDLLGRESVQLDSEAISSYLEGKRVLVTGGGGSIGSELSRQVASKQPNQLVIFENSELNLYKIEHELKTSFPELTTKAVLGDVKDADRVEWLFTEYQPDVVFHAAAYKHVPLVEANPAEGVGNNVFGTIMIADAADRFKAKKFVMVSTDKAVNPSNVMGATKRIAEIYCQNLNNLSDTHFITTRFGNVLGSTGSVVPLFQRQIREGGPVTVTSKEVRRYFMTIPEATGLILQAGAMGIGGEIYVLDMGESVLIRELAEQMIRLSGFEPYTEIDIHYIGLRPGEKLYEELFYEQEALQDTTHPKLYLANSQEIDWDWFMDELQYLKSAVEARNTGALQESILKIVPEYQDPDSEKPSLLSDVNKESQPLLHSDTVTEAP